MDSWHLSSDCFWPVGLGGETVAGAAARRAGRHNSRIAGRPACTWCAGRPSMFERFELCRAPMYRRWNREALPGSGVEELFEGA